MAHTSEAVNKNLIIFFIMLLIPITGASLDIHVPSLPAIKAFFHENDYMIQATVTLYILGYGIGQLFVGIISDCIGRRKTVLYTTIIFAISCYVCTLIHNFYLFLFARLVQGIMVAGCGIVAKSLPSDVFEGKELAIATNYLVTAWALGTIVAPTLGGYLQEFFSWRACFHFLWMYGCAIFVCVYLFLPETQIEPLSFDTQVIGNHIKTITTNKIFIACFLLLGMGWGSVNIFNVIGPFLVQDALKYSAIVYGHYAMLLGLSWFLGNMYNRILLKYFNNKQIITSSLWALVLVNIVNLTTVMHVQLSLTSLFLPTCAILFFTGSLYPHWYTIVLSLFPKLGGIVNALIGLFFCMSASGLTWLASTFKLNTSVPLFSMFMGISILAVFIYYALVGRDHDGKLV